MHFRIARHTCDLDRIKRFYTEVFGLNVLGSFANHDGYEGVFIGKKDLGWHLEFTTSDEEARHHFDDDDILVFYPTSRASYEKLIQNIERLKVKKLSAKNPYWNDNGIVIKDPDGHTVILSDSKAK